MLVKYGSQVTGDYKFYKKDRKPPLFVYDPKQYLQ